MAPKTTAPVRRKSGGTLCKVWRSVEMAGDVDLMAGRLSVAPKGKRCGSTALQDASRWV
jgi:hypothetical protein